MCKLHEIWVKKNLPNQNTPVLVLINDFWKIGFWYRFNTQIEVMWQCGGQRFFPPKDNIAYWAELPENPDTYKKKEKK